MRILYVEDNATNVILVQRVANMGKHEVVNYGDGQTALDRFDEDKPDLVLLDVQLRGALTGLDVAHKLRVQGCTLPIIAVTAYAMKGDRQRCLDAGCDDYLPKPISVAELVTVFKRYSDAIAAGKPIESSVKIAAQATPASVPAPAEPVSSPVADTSTAKPTSDAPTSDAKPPVTPVVAKPEITPVPVVPAKPASSESPSPDEPVLTHPIEQRTPTPVNAEP